MPATVTRLPIEQVMSTRVAEQRLGEFGSYKYPSPNRIKEDLLSWLEKYLLGRSVLTGWETIKSGVVKSFKSGRVRHVVSGVKRVRVDRGERPRVELYCTMDVHPVYNWKSKQTLKASPVVLLSPMQSRYFRLCKRCEQRMRELGIYDE